MSKGNYRYETDQGNVYKIRLDSKTVSATGGAPAAGSLTDTKMVVRVSGSRRGAGLEPRKINIRKAAGTIGTGATARTVFDTASYVCCTPAGFAAALSAETVSYRGETWQVVSGRSES